MNKGMGQLPANGRLGACVAIGACQLTDRRGDVCQFCGRFEELEQHLIGRRATIWVGTPCHQRIHDNPDLWAGIAKYVLFHPYATMVQVRRAIVLRERRAFAS